MWGNVKKCMLALGLLVLWGHGSADAQVESKGFQLNRYEPTAAGEPSFLVDHPWYSSVRRLAVGLTLNYAHIPLAFGDRAPSDIFRPQPGAVIEHQLMGHVDMALSFADRILFTGSLPITAYEWGTANYGVGPVYGAVGDPRLGVALRLFGQPYRSPFSLSIGTQVWLPVAYWLDRSFGPHIGESGVRVTPKLIFGGLAKRFYWSATVGYAYRPDSVLGNIPMGDQGDRGNYVTSELQMGAAIGYMDPSRFAVIGEVLFGTLLGHGAFSDMGIPKPFAWDYSSLEAMLGLHYNIAKTLQFGVAGGVGFFRQPGVPDGRVLLRIAYAPWGDVGTSAKHPSASVETKPAAVPSAPVVAPDTDGDGIPDSADRCLQQKGEADTATPAFHGCPHVDKDQDGFFDFQDQCPDEKTGLYPDANRMGCPMPDKDKDGVIDSNDQCPNEPQGNIPNPNKPGCPATDQDKDGVFDHVDQCPADPAGYHPDPNPSRVGCPLPDEDKDGVPDEQDACKKTPGVPSVYPKKNGCPSVLVKMSGQQIDIRKPIFFATDKDTVLKKSFPVLTAVAEVIKALPFIKKIVVKGHTDDVGDPNKNLDLSIRRARSVVAILVKQGVDPAKLMAKGYGSAFPIVPILPDLQKKEETKKLNPPEKKALKSARDQNRRVEFMLMTEEADGEISIESQPNLNMTRIPVSTVAT